MIVSFLIPGEAIGKARPRFARTPAGVKTYTTAKTKNYESLIRLIAKSAMTAQGASIASGPVAMRLVVNVKPAASWSKKKTSGALLGEIRPTSKPDLDNVVKAIADALNGTVYLDDAQIVDLGAVKTFNTEAGVYVEVIGL